MSLPMIWFDFGGVLSPPLDDLFDHYHARTGITPRQLKNALAAVATGLGEDDPLAPIELAMLPEPEWGRAMAAALESADPGIDLSRARFERFGEQWFEGVRANSVMVATARHAKEHGYRVGILSNNVVEWEPYWRAVVEPVGEVDCIVDSCKVGVRKPDPEIFRRAEKAAGLDPADCVLIDDLAVNCEAARRTGWRAVHFRNNAQATRDLAGLIGLPALV
ncbi:HAD family hydrolase [Streptomyces sp. NBC_01217]|uniref:HAD family hydrolase n=1 Tax=Streptomyces sp. NBC_01217 TaxID=2903779 RepID=UPI002E0DB26C|nr:HAD family phosphatase [Streptomyces sp. NBC_01217]